MIKSLNQTSNIKVIFNYHYLLAVTAIFVFFTNLDLYLFTSGLVPYPPSFLIVIFSIAFIPVLVFRKNYISVPLLTWGAGFILISIISFLIFPISEAAFQELKDRILSVFFLLLMALIFSRFHQIHITARYALLIATLTAVINNIFNYFNPLVFSSTSIIGRAAGFYINPNISGGALMLGMIFSMTLLNQKYRILFASIVGIGILSTLSRGSILSWLLVVGFFVITGIIRLKKSLISIFVSGLLICGLVLQGVNSLSYLESVGTLSLTNLNVWARFEWLQNPFDFERYSDVDTAARLKVVKLGWDLFLQNPLFGSGIGSTLNWSESISTHNIYLYFMADHGVLGAFFLPLLLLAVTWQARGEAKYIGYAFTIFMVVWGLFSHNIFHERYILIMFSLMSAMCISSWSEYKSLNRKTL